MSVAQLVADLAAVGIRIELVAGQLRYFPQHTMTPDLLERLRASKAELVAMLTSSEAVALIFRSLAEDFCFVIRDDEQPGEVILLGDWSLPPWELVDQCSMSWPAIKRRILGRAAP